MRENSMPIQAPQWTEFLSCPVCYNVFNEKQYRPISLACGHTVCHSCLCKLQQRKCPFDQSLISRDVAELPVNFALLQLVCATALPDSKEECVPGEYRKFYDLSIKHLEDLALLLKPVSSSSTGSIITVSTSNSGNSQNVPNSFLSRPMQRKLITLVSCQLVEEEGRARALRAARSLGERTVTELILQHQNPQQLSSNLWASVRGRGCQFLGPAMQEEVLKLILLALEDGSALSRKVLVLFVVQRLETHYPQASKTAIGHVVQLLYRASCFKVTKREEESSLMQLKEEYRTYEMLRREHDSQIVTKREEESSLMQLKEEYRTYEMLRREHDSQIVQIAMEAGLRIAPDQWSSLLYGDATHKSHMQSIIDKLQTPQTFSQSVSELLIALQRTGDPHNLQRLQPELEFLSSIDPSPDIPAPSWENLDGVMKAVHTVVEGLVDFLQNSAPRRQEYLAPHNSRYKTSMCRDQLERTNCPRGASCTFAHSDEELEKYRLKHRRAQKGHYGAPTHVGYRGQEEDVTEDFDNYRDTGQDLTHVLKSMNINISSTPLVHGETAANQQRGVGHNRNLAPPNKPDGPMRAEMTAGVEATPVSISQPKHVVPPTAAPLANVVPVDPIGDGVMSPTEDVGIATGGVANIQQNVTPPTVQMGPNMGMGQNPMGNMNIHPGMMPGMVAPNNMGLPQGNPAMMHPMGPMQGMYPPFMPPYGGPGPGMHGPRFPIHPMMYHGQYPYMHPYMPYYPQGYMNPAGDAGRMPYDNYYTALNPFAEPWHPGSLHRPPMMQGTMYQDPSRSGQGQVETCVTCCQRQQEEQKQQQKLQGEGHMCKHSPGNHGDNQVENAQGHRQGQSQGHGKTYNVSERSFEEEEYEARKGQKYQSTKSYDETNYQVNKGQGQRSKKEYEGQHEGHYEQYDKRAIGQPKDKIQHHKPEWNSNNAEYNGQKSWRGKRNEYEQDQTYKEGGWSVSDDQAVCYDDYDDKDGGEPYQYDYDDAYQNQYGRTEHRPHKQMRNKEEMYQQSLNQQQAYYTGKGESHGVKKHPKIPILYPKEPSAKLHRQSLKNLQERRNTLLAQLQELNKQVEGHYNDKEEMLEEIWSEDTRKLEEKGFSVDESLPDLFRPQYELIQVDESEAYARTLEHPHPLDVGPVSLKAELISNGDIFERLGAISGVPPRAVNDSIMTSLMTSSLNNVATKDKEDYSYINTSMTDTADTKVQNTYMFNSQPVNKPVNKQAEENMSPRERKKSTDGWRNIDKDFPYWKDVTSNLESPMPTPPTTPKPATVHHNLPTLSHQSIVHNQSTITASSATSPYVSSSYIASNYMSASVSQPNRNKPTAYHDGFTTSTSWESHQAPKTSVPTTCRNISTTTIYNSVANYESNDDYTMKQTSYIPSSYSSQGNEASAYGSEDIYWTTNSQTTAYEPESPLAYFSSTSSNFTEDHIPFVEGSPTISKFGPISRNKQGIKNPALLEAVADETVKTLPVTAVTPIEGPPLPNASTVPSRFTRDEEGQYSKRNTPAETKVTFDKVYSLWASEVNLLEQKAQEASTEDEKLSVKLQAVEMQITLKQQELKQAQAVNLNTSEYMKRERIPSSQK